jgi:hypothetical protein
MLAQRDGSVKRFPARAVRDSSANLSARFGSGLSLQCHWLHREFLASDQIVVTVPTVL